MVITAVVGSAVIGAGASMAASGKASGAAKDAAAQNNATQQQIYNENKATLAPFVGTGSTATKSIEGLLGLSGDSTAANAAFDAYKNSTEYQSRLQEGQKQVTAALGAKGLLDSGAAQKALLNYGQTAASNEFNQYLGNLQTQQQTGLAAASAQAGVGTNYANATNTNNNNAANAAGNAALATAGSINGALSNSLSAYGYLKGQGSSYGAVGGSLSSPAFSTPGMGSGGLTSSMWGL